METFIELWVFKGDGMSGLEVATNVMIVMLWCSWCIWGGVGLWAV